MSGRAPIAVWDVVKTYEVGPVTTGEEDGCVYRFRVEVLRRVGGRGEFCARVWRLGTYRIQPRFPSGADDGPADEPSDEMIWVEDPFFDRRTISSTARAAFVAVMREIKKTFSAG